MADSFKIEVKDLDLLGALRAFLKSILDREEIKAVLTPLRLPMKNVVMPTLVTNRELLDSADPLAPSFPLNAAKLVSKLTRRELGGKVAAVLRPCEIRAFIELVKLKQGAMDEVVLVGFDCLGVYRNVDYASIASEGGDDDSTKRFYESVLSGDSSGRNGMELASACRVCEHMIPDGADVLLGLYGLDVGNGIWVKAQSPSGQELLSGLDLAPAEEPPGRGQAVAALKKKREDKRDEMFAATHEATDSLEKLTAYLADCVNCYNCRVACPVCYCRECVFTTDVFEHEPFQYLRWADRKGAVKMPTDTVFYHLTRLAHISTACVGCGQCSNACPNDIPIMEIFRTVAHKTQASFDYEAGQSLDQLPPLSVFREDEFFEVVDH
ncbi:MAG: 4Fe-4S dicluster domain-containing protein [Thermodesulfobacteriota bacterium]|nr:4Fe-4S dicluster domain-containing protein [Thermodesulfobacteriota bacterium]